MKYLKIIIITGFLSSLLGCGKKKEVSENNPEIINSTIAKPVENITATEDQKERRAKSCLLYTSDAADD